MNILLAVDGSDYTRRMLAHLSQSELFGGGHAYTALTAVTKIPPGAARFLDASMVADYYKDEAEDVFKPVRAFAARQGWVIDVVAVPGPAAESIAFYANEHKPDLIIMGAHGHSALGNMVLGSVTTGVLARCSTPVLLIR